MPYFLTGLAIFFYFGGYLMTARFMSRTSGQADNEMKIIFPPKWLFYILAAPVHKEYPKGAMRVVAFNTQMAGIILGLYLIWYVIARPTAVWSIVGFGLWPIIHILITTYISRRYTEKKPGWSSLAQIFQKSNRDSQRKKNRLMLCGTI